MPSQAMLSRITSTAACDERSRSVSSMRRMKVPFCERAKAHGYSAERMLPRWMKPVGEGAKRVRTVMGSGVLGVGQREARGVFFQRVFLAHARGVDARDVVDVDVARHVHAVEA